jgi:thioesterase domain-containing protein
MRCSVESRFNCTTERITRIWERLLKRTEIGSDVNFFDLGGDPGLATELFDLIRQDCGQSLPPMMIYCAPTIAALAAMLEQPATLRFPPLVQLKAGSDKPPVFIAHGLGATVMDFFQLVKHIRSGHPIYGLQARGVDGMEEPLERIEDMAEYFLEAITRVQSKGPYLLIGHSLGGLVMLEIAQRLTKNGERVAMLTIVDGYPHRRQLSTIQRMRLVGSMARHHASKLTHLPIRKALGYLLVASQRRPLSSREPSRNMQDRQSIYISLEEATRRVYNSSVRAWRHYRPRFYSGKIRFVKAAEGTWFLPKNPTPVWNRLTDDFEVETTPGDHLGILTTNFEALASVLSRYLQEAIGSHGSPNP